MAFELAPLPYDPASLEPYISATTMNLHHDKHLATYVSNLNKLIDGTPLASKSLEEIILTAAGDAEKVGVFNNAGQMWNHNMFWDCLSAQGGGAPSGELAERITADFGSVDAFKEQFKAAALGQFGSGWAWLVVDKGKLKVTKTSNADLPLAHGQTALFNLDVWEHAYYVDYQNRRADYVQAVLDRLINWKFVAENLKKAA